jgi:quercetin dioxygenase-like cupin family protein
MNTISESIDQLEQEAKQSNLRLQNYLFLKGEPQDMVVDNLPEDWMPSFDGGHDLIRGVKLPDGTNAVSAMYRGIQDSVFPGHIHNCDEHLLVLQGRVKVDTPDFSRVLNEGEYVVIKSGLAHKLQIASGSLFTLTWIGAKTIQHKWLGDQPKDCKNRKINDLLQRFEEYLEDENNGINRMHEIKKLLQSKKEVLDAQCTNSDCCSQTCLFT